MRNIVIVLAIFLSGRATQQAEQQSTQQREPLSETDLLLESGFNKLSQKNTKKAIVEFDKAVSLCEDQYTNDEKKSMHPEAWQKLSITWRNLPPIINQPSPSVQLVQRHYI